jgi:hypothetical protein
MMLCFGRNNETHIDNSCHPCNITFDAGFNRESDKSIVDPVGEVGVAWHKYQECLPHNNKFCNKNIHAKLKSVY